MTSVPSIKAIETIYPWPNGPRYRSRLEARWAVFFDTLGIKYEYEKEGYDLGEPGYYLPDFWLPHQQTWIEIKSSDPSDAEIEKAGHLAAHTGNWVDIMVGLPSETTRVFACWSTQPQHCGLTKYINQALRDRDADLLRMLFYGQGKKYVDWTAVLPAINERLPNFYPKINPHHRAPFQMRQRRISACGDCHRLLFGYPDHTQCDYDYIECPVCGDATTIHSGKTHTFASYIPPCEGCDRDADDCLSGFLVASRAAKQARFEHGETPIVKQPPVPSVQPSVPRAIFLNKYDTNTRDDDTDDPYHPY